MRKRTWSRLVRRIAIMVIALPAVSSLYHYVIHVNSTTGALTYLLFVLAAATLWGLPEAMLTSALSMLCLDYYFFPPVPSFGIDDPQNWVAWGSFLITSFVVSELSTSLKKRAFEATARRNEIERMYSLSCNLMQVSSATRLAQDIPSQIAAIFGFPGVAFYDTPSGQLYRSLHLPENSMTEPGPGRPRRKTAGNSPPAQGNTSLVPVQLGGTTIGSLEFTGASISAPAMQSIANLIALAMDRSRKQETVAQAEGARRHQELKTMLLDALAHEFQTPLTSIRAGIHAMLAESPNRDQQEWLEIMNQESERLSGMLAETIQMARIEAGHVDLDIQTHTVEDLVYSSLEKELAGGAQFEIDLPPNLPAVSADAGLIRLVIRQLTRNALKYSQPGTPITVHARAEEGAVVVGVTDRGPGIPSEEQRRIFEEYYRGKQGRGYLTGMGMGLPIARQVVEAHDGRIWVESRQGEGATFSFTLPLAHEEASV